MKKKRKRLINDADRLHLLKSFGNRLRTLREERNLTPTEFEKISGVDNSNLRKYEAGEREAGVSICAQMALALKVELKELFDVPLEFELPERTVQRHKLKRHFKTKSKLF